MDTDMDMGFPDAEGQPTQADAQKVPEAPAAPSVDETTTEKEVDFTFDTSDLTGPGVEVVALGAKISRLPVERIKFSVTHPALISIVTKGAIATKTHYRDGKGSYFCLGAGKKCCELDGLPRVRYVFPIVVYDIDSEYNLRSAKLQYRVLVVGQEQYDAIANISKLNGDISAMDIAVQCSDDKYQKCTYTYAGAARYKKGEKTYKAALQFWKENMRHVLLPVASKWTMEQITGVDPSEGPTPIETSEKVDFDKVFD